MNSEAIWSFYCLVLAYWWIATLYTIQKHRADRNWQPRAISHMKQVFGANFSIRGYITMMIFATLFVSVGGLWILPDGETAPASTPPALASESGPMPAESLAA